MVVDLVMISKALSIPPVKERMRGLVRRVPWVKHLGELPYRGKSGPGAGHGFYFLLI